MPDETLQQTADRLATERASRLARTLRRVFYMQTVEDKARAELAANTRAIFDAERALHSKRQELMYLRRRNAHLNDLVAA